MIDSLKYTFPWHDNDIYLESNDKQVKAVCSNKEIAKFLAYSANQHEFRSTYLQSTIDFQKKTMALLENTTAINYALNALSASMVNVDQLSSQQQSLLEKQQQLESTLSELSASSLSSSNAASEINQKCSTIWNQMTAASRNQDIINQKLLDMSQQQQLETSKLGMIYATQNGISQQFNSISAVHDKIFNSFKQVQNDNAVLYTELNNIAKNQKDYDSQIAQLKTQNNVLTYNLDKAANDGKKLNDSISSLVGAQQTMTQDISKISASIDEKQLAIDTFHEMQSQSIAHLPEIGTVSFSTKDVNDLIVAAKCLLMAMKHIDFDTTSLNAKVLKLSYNDFLNRLMLFEKLASAKVSDSSHLQQ